MSPFVAVPSSCFYSEIMFSPSSSKECIKNIRTCSNLVGLMHWINCLTRKNVMTNKDDRAKVFQVVSNSENSFIDIIAGCAAMEFMYSKKFDHLCLT